MYMYMYSTLYGLIEKETPLNAMITDSPINSVSFIIAFNMVFLFYNSAS